MTKYFINKAFEVLRAELEVYKGQENPEDGWKLKVLHKVNTMLSESGASHYVPVGAEIYLATCSHPMNIMTNWGGPFTLTEDGENFKFHASGIYLQRAITINDHRWVVETTNLNLWAFWVFDFTWPLSSWLVADAEPTRLTSR